MTAAMLDAEDLRPVVIAGVLTDEPHLMIIERRYRDLRIQRQRCDKRSEEHLPLRVYIRHPMHQQVNSYAANDFKFVAIVLQA